MAQHPLGRTGLTVTRIGFGSAPVGYLKTERDEAGRLLNALLDRGVNLIDTAASYPGSEELIGEYVGHRRGEFVLVSKCGSKVPHVDLPDAPAWSAKLIDATVDASLRRCRTDALDVMLLHSCDLKTLQAGEALGALVRARDAGKIKFVGYSGDNEALAYAAAQPDIAVVETSINLVDQVNLDQGLPVCRQHDVGVLVKRPIANAAWKDLADQRGIYQSYAKTYSDRLRQMNLTPATVGLPADAWGELALRFTLSFPDVHCAIIGTTNPANLDLNLRVLDKGPLPADAVAKLRQAFRDAPGSAKWTGQT
ncbi:MAG TPA: aldo/keto reductase [Tepidisphaeraceae bacterium]|nr:aldo/keto reductase [Tepidisphaeraceae bacterium]